MNHPVTEKDMQAMKAALLKREQERWAEQMDRFRCEVSEKADGG